MNDVAAVHFPRYSEPGDSFRILTEALELPAHPEASGLRQEGRSLVRSPQEALFWWMVISGFIAVIALFLFLAISHDLGLDWAGIVFWALLAIVPLGIPWFRLSRAGWRQRRFGRPELRLPVQALEPGMRVAAHFEQPIKGETPCRWSAQLVCGRMTVYPNLGVSNLRYFEGSFQLEMLFARAMGEGTAHWRDGAVHGEVPVEIPDQAVLSHREGKEVVEWRLEVTIRSEQFTETSVFPLRVLPG